MTRKNSSSDRTATKDTPSGDVDPEIQELRAENQALRERLDELESLVKDDSAGATHDEPDRIHGGSEDGPAASEDPSAPTESNSGVSRRGALAGLAALAGVVGLGGTASADDSDGLQDRIASTKRALQTTLELGGAYSTSAGTGLEITETSSTGFSYGLRGISQSDQGRGIFGEATATSGNTYGLWGAADSPQGTGLQGTARSSSGSARGVFGVSKAANGTGTQGNATYTSSAAETYGVRGVSQSDADASNNIHPAGVVGEATGTGENHGVRGSAAASGYGVYSEDDVHAADDLSADDDVFTNVNESSSVSYYYFGGASGTSGPRLYHSDVSGFNDFFFKDANSLQLATEGGSMDLAITDNTIQQTAGPVAKGHINSDGTINSAQNVSTVNNSGGSGGYQIQLTDNDGNAIDYNRNDFVTVVTPNDEYVTSVGAIGASPSYLVVYLKDLNGNYYSGDFNFVTYEGSPGSVSGSSVSTASDGGSESEE